MHCLLIDVHPSHIVCTSFTYNMIHIYAYIHIYIYGMVTIHVYWWLLQIYFRFKWCEYYQSVHFEIIIVVKAIFTFLTFYTHINTQDASNEFSHVPRDFFLLFFVNYIHKWGFRIESIISWKLSLHWPTNFHFYPSSDFLFNKWTFPK